MIRFFIGFLTTLIAAGTEQLVPALLMMTGGLLLIAWTIVDGTMDKYDA